MTFQRKITLGQTIYKFKMSDDMIDKINKIYDKKSKDMIAHNEHLAGKIVEQKRIDNYLDDDVKQFFLQCFTMYLNEYSQMSYGIREVRLFNAWVNEMKENEYNPLHIHRGSSQFGLSSVFCLTSQSVSIHTVFFDGLFNIESGFLNQPFSSAFVKSITA